jgi:hypothetical protein
MIEPRYTVVICQKIETRYYSGQNGGVQRNLPPLWQNPEEQQGAGSKKQAGRGEEEYKNCAKVRGKNDNSRGGHRL